MLTIWSGHHHHLTTLDHRLQLYTPLFNPDHPCPTNSMTDTTGRAVTGATNAHQAAIAPNPGPNMPDMSGTAVPGAAEAYHDVITAAKGFLTRHSDAEVQLLFELQPKRAISIKGRCVDMFTPESIIGNPD